MASRLGEQSSMIPYGGTGYKILCYAKVANRPFTQDDCMNCLSGKYAKLAKPRSAFWESVKVLKRYKLLEVNVVDGVKFVEITAAGVKEIYDSAAYHRTKLQRRLGPRYMAEHKERMAKASNFIFGADDAALDAEEALLVELEDKVRKKFQKKKSA